MTFSSWTYDQRGIDYFPFSDAIGKLLPIIILCYFELGSNCSDFRDIKLSGKRGLVSVEHDNSASRGLLGYSIFVNCYFLSLWFNLGLALCLCIDIMFEFRVFGKCTFVRGSKCRITVCRIQIRRPIYGCSESLLLGDWLNLITIDRAHRDRDSLRKL